MNHYELLCILPGTLSEEEAAAHIKTIQATLVEQGAQELSVEDSGKSRLAYPIKHIRYGYSYICNFAAEPDMIATMQSKIALLGNTLRTLFNAVNPQAKQALAKRLAEVKAYRGSEEQETVPPEPLPKKTDAPEPAEPVATTTKQPETTKIDIDKKLDEILDASIGDI